MNSPFEPDPRPKARRATGIPALGSEFEPFLYAPIGELDDEMPFSVLSALARQNIDPWEEAATLTRLPRESAIARLTPIISSVTTLRPAHATPAATAARLVALLPRAGIFGIATFDNSPAESSRKITPIIIYLIVGALIIASLLVGS
jgi:hypothetical protein